jgi:hypothetical protein
MGVLARSAAVAASTAALSADSVARRRAILSSQLLVRQPLSSDRRTDLPKPLAILVFPFIEPESLFVQVPAQMRRVNTHIGALKGPLQETPEILDIVGMNVTPHEFNRVVNGFMRVVGGKTEIRLQSICIDMRARLDRRANFWRECSALHIWDMRSFDPARSLLAGSLDDAEDGFLPRATSPFDLPLADVTVHILGEPANERFVGFNLAAHLQKRASLHCQSDAVIHEPSGFLRDAERPMHLVAADPVFAVGDHPDCREPLPKVDWAILKDRPDLCRELPMRMLLFALPKTTSRYEPDIGTTTCRTTNAIGPAQFDHCAQRDIRVGEIPDGLNEGLGFGERFDRHADEYGAGSLLSQVYYYPIKASGSYLRCLTSKRTSGQG